jgi:hypothetical protein
LSRFIAYALVIGLGIILTVTFFKPWLPDFIHGWGFDAYEPNTACRIFEGCIGIAIMGLGIERLISAYKER